MTGGQVLDSDLPADDDDLLGHRGGRLVPPAHGDEAGTGVQSSSILTSILSESCFSIQRMLLLLYDGL